MIKDKTVFILGAGANAPYGFPTAKKLIEDIRDKHIGKLKNLINNPSRNRYELFFNSRKEFINKLKKSPIDSIDAYISICYENDNNSWSDFGKQAIILELLTAEKNLQKEYNPSNSNWLEFLFNQLIKEGSKFSPDIYKNNVSFITFNYDRLLEHFFASSLMPTFGLLDQAAVNIVSKLEIFNVYGNIANLYSNNDIRIPFGFEVNLNTLIKLTSNIQVIYDERDNRKIDEIKSKIKSAKRIYILGFGFAEENIDAIDLYNCVTNEQKIYATSYGLATRTINRLKVGFSDAGLNISNNLILDPIDCEKFLIEYLE